MQYAQIPALLGLQGSPNGAEFGAICPFHRDTRPSFSFNMGSGLWTCYTGCGGGTAAQLVERVKDLSPLQAQRWLRSHANLGVQHTQTSTEGGDRAACDQRPQGRTFDLQRAVPAWFLARGFTKATARRWNLQYDSSSAGLYIPCGEGWILRSPPGVNPKYINSPGLEDPYGVLVGMQAHPLVLVEGPLDALWVWQSGYTALALLGGRITEHILAAIRAYDPAEVVLATDNDYPGRALAKRLFPVLNSHGYRVSEFLFPDARKDVQELTELEVHQGIQQRSSPLAHLQVSQDGLSLSSLERTRRFERNRL